MSNQRRSYDDEFKEGAVRIVRETGKSIASVARDLNRPGFRAHVVMCEQPGGVLVLIVVDGFGFGWWDEAEEVHQAAGVVPVDPG